MKNHLKHLLLFAMLTVCSVATAVAQATLKGKVVDAETKEPLIGATVAVSGTSLGSITDIDGNFTVEIRAKKAVLVFSYVGYSELRREVNVSGSKADLGEIALTPDAVGLEEVSVIASIIKSDRQTPIPISNVKLAQIEEKVGNLEFPEFIGAPRGAAGRTPRPGAPTPDAAERELPGPARFGSSPTSGFAPRPGASGQRPQAPRCPA